MYGKWPFFAMGLMVGTIAALSVALALNAGAARADAAPSRDVDNIDGVLLAGVGGIEANRNDMIWIIYKRETSAEEDGGSGSRLPKERITLALYKPPPRNTTKPIIELQSVREITWDLQLMQLPSKQKPSLTDVIKALKEQNKKKP